MHQQGLTTCLQPFYFSLSVRLVYILRVQLHQSNCTSAVNIDQIGTQVMFIGEEI
jgi:hypothetical protein